MRSRYAAYARGLVDYILATHDPASRADVDERATAEWARRTTWTGLEILATERGAAGDDDGVVEFVARGTTGGQAFAHHERSRFRRVDGRWFYVDGVTPKAATVRRTAPEVGRNDPCPCGSGKKYKRCHGA
jgi:SEC-C motif-containing protein